MSDIQLVDAPAGIEGAGFFATTADKVLGIARANSLWPLPFATSCCGIEFMATAASHYDIARFGAERMSFSPRQADLLMVMGTISKKMGPVLRQVYLQMAEPRWVLSMGACASSGFVAAGPGAQYGGAGRRPAGERHQAAFRGEGFRVADPGPWRPAGSPGWRHCGCSRHVADIIFNAFWIVPCH